VGTGAHSTPGCLTVKEPSDYRVQAPLSSRRADGRPHVELAVSMLGLSRRGLYLKRQRLGLLAPGEHEGSGTESSEDTSDSLPAGQLDSAAVGPRPSSWQG
jgi:hypothetical protein